MPIPNGVRFKSFDCIKGRLAWKTRNFTYHIFSIPKKLRNIKKNLIPMSIFSQKLSSGLCLFSVCLARLLIIHLPDSIIKRWRGQALVDWLISKFVSIHLGVNIIYFISYYFRSTELYKLNLNIQYLVCALLGILLFSLWYIQIKELPHERLV